MTNMGDDTKVVQEVECPNPLCGTEVEIHGYDRVIGNTYQALCPVDKEIVTWTDEGDG